MEITDGGYFFLIKPSCDFLNNKNVENELFKKYLQPDEI